MQRKTRIVLALLLCGALVVVAGCGASQSDAAALAAADQQGRAAAQRDLDNGLLKIRVPPLPNPPWWNQYDKLLKDRGITMEVVSNYKGPDSPAGQEMEAYNAVMRARIESKFGRGILGRLEEQAQGK